MPFLIEAQKLVKRYGDHVAVDGIEFNVNPGEIVGFLGPNGAGKTTTIKMLTGLLEPDEGRGLIAGKDIQREPLEAKARFAYVPDTPELYGKLRAEEYLRFIGQLYRVPPERVDARMRELLAAFELEDRAGEYLEGYSHGEIATALGVAEGTSKARLSRARSKLRETLGPAMQEYV